jgi:F0F1-type ATP synthase membrane subunit c/vacuolar-type H+-ATPase subunit K
MNSLKEWASSPYMTPFWWLVAVLLIMCFVAYPLRSVLRGGTIVYRCHLAWAIVFSIHGIISGAVMLGWYTEHGMFTGFYRFFPFYAAIFLIGLVFALVLFWSLKRYKNYF